MEDSQINWTVHLLWNHSLPPKRFFSLYLILTVYLTNMVMQSYVIRCSQMTQKERFECCWWPGEPASAPTLHTSVGTLPQQQETSQGRTRIGTLITTAMQRWFCMGHLKHYFPVRTWCFFLSQRVEWATGSSICIPLWHHKVHRSLIPWIVWSKLFLFLGSSLPGQRHTLLLGSKW